MNNCYSINEIVKELTLGEIEILFIWRKANESKRKTIILAHLFYI